jgi:predicted TIM-barrel fold metal-dependent hydrolase
MKIDIYAHITSERYRNALFKYASASRIGRKRMEDIPTLWDLDNRFRIMDHYDDYKQVISMIGIPIESVARGRDAVELAKIANDEAAELVAKYPDRFLGAVANLPLGDTDAALKELDRAINELRLKGILIYTPLYPFNRKTEPPAGGKGMDSPELMPIYEAMAKYNLPIWIHPNPFYDDKVPDYTSETGSKYLAWHIYGWPYQDTLAQVRLVFSGILEKIPNLKFINHHAGAMVPFFESRLTVQTTMAEMRGDSHIRRALPKSPTEYFRMFYSDTAVNGGTAALMCAYAFYGAEHMLFATDMPFDKELGDEAIRETIRAIERMDITAEEKAAIFEGNAIKLLHFD